MNHCLRGGALARPTERHEDGARTDRGVKPFTEAAFGGNIEVVGEGEQTGGEALWQFACERLRRCHMCGGVLLRPVRVKEVARQVNDGLPVPHHGQASIVRDCSDNGRLEVLFGGEGEETLNVTALNNHGHAFLRLANR